MARIKVQSVPSKKVDAKTLLAELCYYYPQYSLAVARRLPAKDVMLLLKVARKKDAERYFYFTQIVAAPHSKKGAAVKKLSDKFKGMMNG